MEQGAFMDVIRMFFAFIDGIVYNLIGDAHNLVIDIAHYKVFENVNELTNKVYAALGIFMLFKVSFSFINYLINPDSFTDKEKGVQHVIKNIIIMFIMLISCPWAFETLWQLQADILDEAVIENFVFGDEDRSLKEYKMMDSCSRYSVAASNGDYIALMVLKGFYKPYTSAEIGYDLSNDDDYDSDYSEVKDKLCSYVINGTPTMYLVADVYNADADVDGASFPIIGGDLDIYIMDYKIIMSTAVGVVVLLILVGFAMDVGLRVVKLSFLELFAPIPIVSYIDPASGKNGMFKKWLKEVGATWASIFIRLLALYFSVRVIQEVGSLHHVSGSGQEASVWVVIFVIIGALMFAKQLPKLIQNITGVNLDGGFSLNPMKKFKNQALGGKEIVGGLGAGTSAVTSAVGSAISHANARHRQTKQLSAAKNGVSLADQKLKDNAAEYSKKHSELNQLKAQRLAAERKFNNTNPNDARAMQKALSSFNRLDAQVNAKKAEISDIVAKGKDLKSERNEAQEKYDKKTEELQNSRLYNNVATGYIGEIARGALYGAKNGYSKPGHLVHNTAEAVKDSSEMRNYREKYSVGDQIGERKAQVLGIKNESGTTSIVKRELKASNDNLNEINRSIEMLNRSISQIAGEMGAEFQKAIKYKSNGRMEVNLSYSGPQAGKIPDLEQLISSYYDRIDEKIRVEKNIKDLKDTADSVRPGTGKKS